MKMARPLEEGIPRPNAQYSPSRTRRAPLAAPTMAGLGTPSDTRSQAMDTAMSGPNGTALLVGRDHEVAALSDALRSALQGTPQTVLVGGDAGIGKTTLLTHVADQAARLGFTVAVGHCLDLEAGIPFAPVVEAVRALVLADVDLDARPAARRLRSLLDPAAPTSLEPPRVLEELRQTVLEAAASRPLLLVLEDMHWADQSTQDLVSALSRTARGQLVLVLTFRSEALHRRHTFRASLTEIGRAPGSRRLDLGPLGADAVAGIVSAHEDGTPDAAVVAAVLARSEGNPLYAEELVAADAAGIPGHLSDLLLARVDALGAGPRSLLRYASVSGSRLETDTLSDLAGLDRAQTETFLREALDANVLRQRGDTLEFRHGLLREAVYDDLLPDERARIHARARRAPPGQGGRGSPTPGSPS